MKTILNAVNLVTEKSFNYQTGKNERSHLEIDSDYLNALMTLLGAKAFAIHMIIISNWKNPKGLPSCEELAAITKLSVNDIEEAMFKLLNFEIGGEELYNKEKLKEKNIQDHEIYHV